MNSTSPELHENRGDPAVSQSLLETLAMLLLGIPMFQSRRDSLGDVKVFQGISARNYSEVEGTLFQEKKKKKPSSKFV